VTARAEVVASEGPAGEVANPTLPTPPPAYALCRAAARAADAKLGEEPIILAMGELLGVVDAFVITSGRNARQVRSLVEEIERVLKAHDGVAPGRVEGLGDASWVLMDYGDFVVHVFSCEARAYYDLEHLWSGAVRVPWEPEGT
jgi:ribosome-associated protein